MKTLTREQLYQDGQLLEAVLHLLDGSSRELVAKRFGFSIGYLTMVKHGHKRREIRNQALDIYREHREKQRSKIAFDLTQVRQPATPQE